MVARGRRLVKPVVPLVLIGVLVLLSAGTISNQLRINAANTRFARQAANGQRAFARSCRLVPVSLKIYADALARHKITIADFLLVQTTAQRACAPVPPKP